MYCQRTQVVAGNGSGSGVGNGAVMGMVIYPGGAPVKGATVRLRPQSYLADTSGALPVVREGLIDSLLTDSCGRFLIDSLDSGNSYFIEVSDSSRLTQATIFKVSVSASDSILLATRTVAPVATLSGTISLSDLPANAYIQIYGLERIGKTDSVGNYKIPNLPVGNCSEHECEYKIRILVPNSAGGYTAKESEIEVTAGGIVRLDD